MKKNNKIKTKSILTYAMILVSFSACMDYDAINTPKYLPQDLPIGNLLEQMQLKVYPVQENDYQYCQSLIGDVYGRYMTITKPRNTSFYQSYATFNASDEWLNAPFDRVFGTLYPNWIEIREKTEGQGVTFAWAQILRVAAMQRMTDLWGPIPYSQVATGSIQVAYDSQEDVYKNMFIDLDNAIGVLSDYALTYPTDRPMEDYDRVYGGDYTKWVRFANSLKLRMAMRIVYADPALAQRKAEEAVSHPIGVIERNDDNASIAFTPNPIKIMWDNYKDARACADIVTYMQGYNDPRMSAYFLPHTIGAAVPALYHGLRSGIDFTSHDWALTYSAPNFNSTEAKTMWMNAAEIAFLKAEGAMRSWNMGPGTVESLYNEGIKLSFEQHGATGYDTYIANNTWTQAPYVDPTFSEGAQSTITIRWNDSALDDVKLERIITQKWIAMWPLGQEAWSEHRRTGFPRFFPVRENRSSDATLTTNLASRIPFPPNERIVNAANYTDAVSKLEGADSYGTRLWWDQNPNKP